MDIFSGISATFAPVAKSSKIISVGIDSFPEEFLSAIENNSESTCDTKIFAKL